MFGLNALYWYYDEEVRKHVEIKGKHTEESHIVVKAEESFGRYLIYIKFTKIF